MCDASDDIEMADLCSYSDPIGMQAIDLKHVVPLALDNEFILGYMREPLSALAAPPAPRAMRLRRGSRSFIIELS